MSNWKVIFSKKGFDDSTGGYPSIILPEKYHNKMISFPIPEIKDGREGIKAEEITYNLGNGKSETLQELFNQLEILDKIKYDEKSKTIRFNKNKYHYDPVIQEAELKDKKLYEGSIPTYAALGQSGDAASVLLNKGSKLEKNDVFLFFGTFKKTLLNKDEKTDKEILSYDTKMHKIHAIWGYMIVDDVVQILEDGKVLIQTTEGSVEEDLKTICNKYPDLENHLHYINRDGADGEKSPNIIVLSKRFDTFNFTPKNQLTKMGYSRTVWELQECFDKAKMEYQIKNKDKVINDFHRVLINGRGQELVVTGFEETEMKKWLGELGIKKEWLKEI